MENKKLIIAGGTGFIGQAICNYFGASNEIVVLTRQLPGQQNNAFGENRIRPAAVRNMRSVQWDGATVGDWSKEIEGAEMIINLAGKSVNCRYTKKNKREIFDSRTHSVQAIGQAIRQAVHPPKCWINAASATIYPHATDTAHDESFVHFADDFSVQVCKLWEKTFYEQRTPFTRKIALRMAITLGAGGVMTPYFNLLKFGLGGRQGSGKQMYSWIHVTDTCRMIEWIAEHTDMEGTYNCVSPNAVTNEIFMRTLRRATGNKFGLPAYEWMLRIGAWLIGTEPELVLKSRWVLPTRILQSGFTFYYSDLDQAFAEIVAQTPRKRYHLF
ncbi:MAG TPA: TIGR01777 family oxidoreductase [Ferruginibacter sp.]|nr:TIGR01777 family oxidoreductase [Ferruginibacter sp.]HNF03209.1 TIGR01777 family oxidoreductase [Ferruginibacter sp.]